MRKCWEVSRSTYATEPSLSDAAVSILTRAWTLPISAGQLVFIHVCREIQFPVQNWAQTAAGPVLIYRFVCHPHYSLRDQHSNPWKAWGRQWGERFSCTGIKHVGGCGALWWQHVWGGGIHVPIRAKSSRVPAPCVSDQRSHGSHGKHNEPEGLSRGETWIVFCIYYDMKSKKTAVD